MNDSTPPAGRFDPNRLAGWLLTGTGDSPVREDSDWLRVLDTLSNRVYQALDDGADWQRYAEAFVRALTGAEQAGVREPNDVLVSWMNLISVIVASVPAGDLPGAWQPARAAEMFFDRLPMSAAEAFALADMRPRPPVPDLIRLRHIKQMLNPLIALRQHLHPDAVARLLPWFELRDRLP